MNATEWINLPSKEKKKIIKGCIRAANKDQLKLIKQYEQTKCRRTY